MQFSQCAPMGAVDEKTVDIHACRRDEYYQACYGYPHEYIVHIERKHMR